MHTIRLPTYLEEGGGTGDKNACATPLRKRRPIASVRTAAPAPLPLPLLLLLPVAAAIVRAAAEQEGFAERLLPPRAQDRCPGL